MILQILVQLCLNNSLDTVWTLYLTLQIITYTDIYSIIQPGNVEIFNAEITKIVEFDLLDPEALI